MRVAIVGAGRMGSAIGVCMKRAGDEVILVDTYKDHIDRINEKGLDWIKNTDEPVNVRFDGAYCSSERLAVCDAVILLTSGLCTAQVLEGAIGNIVGPDTYVVSFMNGLGHVENIAKYIDIDHILHGMLKLAGRMIEPGVVLTNAHPDCCVVIGSVRQEEKANEMCRRIAASITAGGIVSEFHEDIDYVVWEKVLNNCCWNGVCSLTRSTMGNLIVGEHGRPIMLSIIREVVAVANAKGIPLSYITALDFIDTHSLKNYRDHLPSMTYDVRAKRLTEIDFLNGAISKFGKELDIPTPTNDLITNLIHMMEEGYSTGF